ncbi:hypothetical protein [Pseudokordiimonas caeni]|uniref:hypothetical protein n=1 Tax=Pseudokordiimonas caeni TaxID=2997908 RepID=UPI002811F354|nr:hypothetical protein [Pseudokordiimonas caeni]
MKYTYKPKSIPEKGEIDYESMLVRVKVVKYAGLVIMAAIVLFAAYLFGKSVVDDDGTSLKRADAADGAVQSQTAS